MSAHDNKALWKLWLELWNGNLSIADGIIAPNFVAHLAPAGDSPGEVRDPEGLKQWIGGTLANFSGYSFTTTIGPLAGEDKVAGRWSFGRCIKAAYLEGRLPQSENASSTQAWISFASNPRKSSNTGCVQTFCDCFDK